MKKNIEGLILKGIGGFYYVDTELGLMEAKGRGNLKNKGEKLKVGDIVDLEVTDFGEKKAVVNYIHQRKNEFIRPPVSNIDMLILTISLKKPKPDLRLLDRLLIMAEIKGVEPVICINKWDLKKDKREDIDEIIEIYEKIYKVIKVSTVKEEGIKELLQLIKGKRIALAGPSGVGKSSIVNLLHPNANMQTGEISTKTGRGKHTTRHVEIFKAKGGALVYDTPGFTAFDIKDIDEALIKECYPEINRVAAHCYYRDCSHLKEPDCQVIKAVEKGEISLRRYESYKQSLEEIRKENKKQIGK